LGEPPSLADLPQSTYNAAEASQIPATANGPAEISILQ